MAKSSDKPTKSAPRTTPVYENLGGVQGKMYKLRKMLIDLAPDFIIFMVILSIIIISRMFFVTVSGSSMYPTLETGNVKVQIPTNQATGLRGTTDVSIGDIVTVKRKADLRHNKDYMVVKRVVAKGGDEVLITEDGLTINGKPEKTIDNLDLSDVKYEPTKYNYKNLVDVNDRLAFKEVVPEGYVFLLGDNRGNSTDSRMYGSVPVEAVSGVLDMDISSKQASTYKSLVNALMFTFALLMIYRSFIMNKSKEE